MRTSLGGLSIIEIELKNLIFEYQEFNSKKTLTEILNYFKDIICNISKKLNYEEANTDITIELIVILKKINLSNCKKDTATKAKIIHSLLNRRTDLFRKYVLKSHKELQLNLEILTTYNYNDDSNLIVEDLSKINNFILILIVIIFTYLCHNIFIKGPIICEEKKNKDLMYSLIGLDEVHSKFFLELKDDNLIIFSKNIENTIFYNEIEKIFFKKDSIILFLKNRVNITIPKTSDFEELSRCLKSKLNK